MKIRSKILISMILTIVIFAFALEVIMHLQAKSALKAAMQENVLNYSYQFQGQKPLDITMVKGSAYAGIVRNGLLEYVTTPLIAIWVEDEQGNLIKTLYVSSKLFNINRPAALPVWAHKTNAASENNQFVDGVSSASHKGNQVIFVEQVPLENAKVCIELNRSYDYNDYYKSGLKPGDIGYNADFSGQPSLIYQAAIPEEAGVSELNFNLIGHGSEDGSNGDITTNLEHITTGRSLMSKISLHIR